jgi:AraC family transcriptional regulator of adaptative response/methylated-DNA-[protein]-cysteine methyltransferase
VEREIAEYFAGHRTTFETPLHALGSPFERRVWDQLQKIPLGATRSYADVARAIGEPLAYRAVARANGANTCAIMIPCHRVINTNGELGGYGGGLARKRWLLDHERTIRGTSD